MSVLSTVRNWFSTKYSAAGWATAQYFFARPVWTPRDYEHFAKEAYQKNVVAFACIAKMASTVASVPLYLMDGDKEIETHPLLDLLRQPNPFMSYEDFIEAIVSFYMISGNSYMERVDSFSQALLNGTSIPTELYPLRPDRMRVIPDRRGWPMAYTYNVGGLIQQFDIDVPKRKMPILHIKSFNPTNDWYGMSPIEAAIFSIDTHTEASAWNKALLQNSGGPPGIINSKKALTVDQRASLKQEIAEKYSGPFNAGKPMIGDGEMEWIQMGFSPKDMEWINSKNITAREICLAFFTPPQILGIPGDNTYSNLQEANIAYARGGVVPILRRFVGGLNRWLCADFGPAFRLCYDEDAIPGLAQERHDLYAKLEATRFLTTDEKREASGYEKYEAGNEKEPGSYILSSSSDVILEDVVVPSEPETDPNADQEDVGDVDDPIDPDADPEDEKPPVEKPKKPKEKVDE